MYSDLIIRLMPCCFPVDNCVMFVYDGYQIVVHLFNRANITKVEKMEKVKIRKIETRGGGVSSSGCPWRNASQRRA